MKTTQNTHDYTITLTDIRPDYDDPTRLELSFRAELTLAYVNTTGIADIFADENENDDLADLDTVPFEFNLATRHNHDCLYVIISGDRSGDYYDDLDHVTHAFGQPIIDFIADTCRILNVPFYTNAD